jgi:hypothetical protein
VDKDSFIKGKVSLPDTDLVIGGNIFKFYKETMMDKTVDLVQLAVMTQVKYQRSFDYLYTKNKENLSVKRSGVTNLMGKRFIGKICMVQTESGSRTILH